MQLLFQKGLPIHRDWSLTSASFRAEGNLVRFVNLKHEPSTCHGAHVEIEGNFWESALPPPCGSEELNSGPSGQQQVPLPAEPSYQPLSSALATPQAMVLSKLWWCLKSLQPLRGLRFNILFHPRG